MSFEKLLCAIIASYGLLNFVIQPRLTKAWNASRTVGKVARAGVLAAVQLARNTAFVATVMYLTLALLAAGLGFGFGQNAGFLHWVVESATELHERLEQVQNLWGDWFFLLPLALIIYVNWRTLRNKLRGRFERLVDDELDRLNEERAKSPKQWTELTPDDGMRALDEQIAQAKAQLAKLAAAGPQDRSARRGLLRSISQLSEKRNEMDYQRRVNLGEMNVPEDEDEQPAWQRILLSKGLFSDLQGFSKLLGRLTLATLSLALIGVAGAAGLTEDIWKGIIRLDELRVEATTKKAEELWKEHHAKNAQQNLSASDQQAINHLANDFAHALAVNPHWQSLHSQVQAHDAFEHSLGREAVLSKVELPDADGGSRAAFSDGLSRDEKEVLDDAVSGEANRSRVGRIVAERHGLEIKIWFGDRWEGVKHAILEHAGTYHEPVGMSDLQGELIDRVVAAAFDAGSADTSSDVVKQARDAMTDATKEAAREAVETELRQMVEDLDSGKPYNEVMEKVRTKEIPISRGKVEELAVLMHERKLPDARDFQAHMAASPGSWKDPDDPNPPSGGPTPDGPMGGTPKAEDIVKDIAGRATHNGEYSLAEEEVGALAEYEDHFPRSVASQTSTELGKVLTQYRVAGDAEAFARMATLNVERAGSFSMLRGFSKVGGVLIGQAPQGSADIRDLRWQASGRNVTLTLVDAVGKESSFGPFDKSLVHQSLAYAADGRPVAVTMTIARPVPGLKIFLHPALLDTPLGCRVQELDRLVDTYAGEQLPERETMTEQYDEQISVYNLALAKRREAIAEKTDSEEFKKSTADMIAAYERGAAKGLRGTGIFAEASILRRKPEFFDPSLIRTAKSCQTQDVQEFEKCVLEDYRGSRAIREFKKDELGRWMVGPTEMEPWSGVRERSYRIGNDLAFLRTPNGDSVEDRLWPFDFIVQIAFTSAAINLPEKQQEQYVDRQPIEFDAIKTKIAGLVKSGIDKDGFRPQFEDLRNFAILQRLFRAALNGNLGSRFPTLKLARLTAETAGAAPYFHTKRWNSSIVGRMQYLTQMAELPENNPQPWMQREATRLRACDWSLERTVETGSDQGDLTACQFGEIRGTAMRACPEGADVRSAGCIWRSLVMTSNALAKVQTLEIAFHVLDDLRQSSGGTDCPALMAEKQQIVKR